MPFHTGSSASIHYEQTGSGPDIIWVGGGGARGQDWQRFQTPHFAPRFRSTVFDNRGIGRTACTAPLPWPIADFARDVAELVKGVCDGPVVFIGSSLGSAIVQEVAIDHPELVKCAIVMGTGAWSTGWGWDYQAAEIEFRRRGGNLDGMMGVAHYASMLYPARALGDRVLWPKLKWTCPEKVESFLLMKGDLDDETETVYGCVQGGGGWPCANERSDEAADRGGSWCWFLDADAMDGSAAGS
ncbi:alpha/beta hydrolase [Mesorhizobium sp. PAMC28654]|uniref:alpha/beta fold hydrolase n=1 Tax=Mesorhizobium sp. PAMC28654 TaxID=2880934 RepID=UPI001D0ADF46|nr:alpha/beta hydrolase [Mesorhizobium sp. PAMC28654]UDL91853.1 alpha/beta hydrolase [Mesorhizobium sp. PAMC28654]